MGDQDAITASEDYRRFRSSIPQRKVRAACDLVLRMERGGGQRGARPQWKQFLNLISSSLRFQLIYMLL